MRVEWHKREGQFVKEEDQKFGLLVQSAQWQMIIAILRVSGKSKARGKGQMREVKEKIEEIQKPVSEKVMFFD